VSRGHDHRAPSPKPVLRHFTEEQLITIVHDGALIQRRSDIAVWCSLFREALRRVARLQRERDQQIAAYGSFVAENPDLDCYEWDDRARTYRPLRVESPRFEAFCIVAPRLDSEDVQRDARIWFDANGARGIVVRAEGFPDNWMPSLRHIPHAPHIDDADRIAAKMIQLAIDQLDPMMQFIPAIPAADALRGPPSEETLRETDAEIERATKARFADPDPELDRARRQQAARVAAEHRPKRKRAGRR
jgi:hypothetical protein